MSAAGRRLRRLVVHCAASSAIACLMSLGLAMPAAHAGDVLPGAAAPPISIEQRLGAKLPLASPFVDADGRPVRLGDYFARDGDAGVPVVLILGYYRCPRLCQTVAEGAIEALAESGVAPSAYRVVTVSIDPAEQPADARAARDRDLAWAKTVAANHAASEGSLRLASLVGPATSIDALASAVGFGFRPVDDPTHPGQDSFVHAAGFVVVTPAGRVSRYFLGVRHDPAALRAALADAAGNAIGSVVDRLVLLCAHIDPSVGRYSRAVLGGLRGLGLALMLGLAGWLWHLRRPARGAAGGERLRP